MKSFGLGKKQREQPKLLHPPTSNDLTQLLATSQKTKEKPFSLVWQSADNEACQYILTVTSGGAQRDRRGWTSSAIDQAAIGDAEWRLQQEIESNRTEIFSMRSSDALLIKTLIDESLATGPAAASGFGTPFGAESAQAAQEAPPPKSATRSTRTGLSRSGQQNQTPAQAPAPAPPEFQEGNLRQTPVRTIMESYNSNKITGRLICDIGTVTAEVFFTAGEPVHAKSCHSIFGKSDTIGDDALVDLLTWKDGTYKFQQGWPAASHSITEPLQKFLAGEVGGNAQVAGSADASPTGTSTSASTPAFAGGPAITPAIGHQTPAAAAANPAPAPSSPPAAAGAAPLSPAAPTAPPAVPPAPGAASALPQSTAPGSAPIFPPLPTPPGTAPASSTSSTNRGAFPPLPSPASGFPTPGANASLSTATPAASLAGAPASTVPSSSPPAATAPPSTPIPGAPNPAATPSSTPLAGAPTTASPAPGAQTPASMPPSAPATAPASTPGAPAAPAASSIQGAPTPPASPASNPGAAAPAFMPSSNRAAIPPAAAPFPAPGAQTPAAAPSSSTPTAQSPAAWPSTPGAQNPAAAPGAQTPAVWPSTPAVQTPAVAPISSTPAAHTPAAAPSSSTPSAQTPAAAPSSSTPAAQTPAAAPSSSTPAAQTPAAAPSSSSTGPASPASTTSTTSSPVPPALGAAPPAGTPSPDSASPAEIHDSTDDFSLVDDSIGEAYCAFLENSGLIKYGLFLMLTRCEFVRYEIGKNPFCFAAIGVEVPNGQLSDEMLGNIGQCFESACQPLDIVAHAGKTRLFALLPQSSAEAAIKSLTAFVNNIRSAKVEKNLPGSVLRISIGLAEVPRDGSDFQLVFEHACSLRQKSTPQNVVVTSPH